MHLLTRYILRQIWGPMLLASVVISFVAIAGAIQQEIKELVKDVPIAQFTAWDVSRVSFFVLPTMVGYVFPITFLFGILLVFGQLARNSETVAMKAAGIPMRRLVVPIILAGAVLSGICFWVQDVGQVWAYRRLAHLLRSDLPLRVTLDMLPTGVMHNYGDWRVYIGGKDGSGSLRDIVVLEEGDDGVTMTHAERARLLREPGQMVLEMENVYRIPPGLQQTWKTNPFRLTVPALEPRSQEGTLGDETLAALFSRYGSMAASRTVDPTLESAEAKIKLQIEIAERFAFPLMCLAVSFVGAPLGARTPRSGRSYVFASGFMIVALYFILRKAVEPLTYLVGLGATLTLCQVPNLLLCALGAVLLWRVDRV